MDLALLQRGRQQRYSRLGICHLVGVLQDVERRVIVNRHNIIAQAGFKGSGATVYSIDCSCRWTVSCCHDKSGLLWVITLSLTSLLLFFTAPNLQLFFDRPLIAEDEGWRIITGNLAHTNL